MRNRSWLYLAALLLFIVAIQALHHSHHWLAFSIALAAGLCLGLSAPRKRR